MEVVAANDARNHWGELLITAQKEPVMITSYGRTVAVVMEPQLARRALAALEKLEKQAALEKSQDTPGA